MRGGAGASATASTRQREQGAAATVAAALALGPGPGRPIDRRSRCTVDCLGWNYEDRPNRHATCMRKRSAGRRRERVPPRRSSFALCSSSAAAHTKWAIRALLGYACTHVRTRGTCTPESMDPIRSLRPEPCREHANRLPRIFLGPGASDVHKFSMCVCDVVG